MWFCRKRQGMVDGFEIMQVRRVSRQPLKLFILYGKNNDA
jgi:hypothetical protein